MPQPTEVKPKKEPSFTGKVWIAGAIFAFIIVMLMLLRATFSAMLLVLAGLLIAVFFRGLAGKIQQKTNWKEGICVALSIIITVVVITVIFWLIGAKVQQQIQQLTQTLPGTIDNARNWLNQSTLGSMVVEKISAPETQQQAERIAQTFFSSTFGVLGDLYIVFFIAVFFTASPQIYRSGIVALVPAGGKEKAGEVLLQIGDTLKKWLKGQLFAMFVVFVLSGVGLLIIGVPMWLGLAVIAGFLNFIPNFGPLIAMIPAVLVGLMDGPATAAMVAGLYIFVQTLESNFITPMVQQRLINIPPALIILAQLFIAPLTGGWGLVLATPLLVVIIVVVQELYVKPQEAAR